MRRAKVVYGGEWVKVQNLMNSRFKAAAPCELCRKIACVSVWHSIKDGRVRCLKCFTPDGAA